MADTDPEYRTTYKKLASGRTKIYYYTKPGGTKFFEVMDNALTKPFPIPFLTEYQAAIDSEKPRAEGDCAQFIVDYQNSPKFQKLSRVTQESYTRCLTMIRSKFGSASVRIMENRRFKQHILRWHEEMAKSSPRGADTTVIVFKNALDYAKKRGLLLINPAEAIEPAYKPPAERLPWTKEEIATFLADPTASDHVKQLFLLAMHTGLRRKDLVSLPWDAWKGTYIECKTSKSRYRRTVLITLLDEAQEILRDMKRRQMESPLGLQRTIVVGEQGGSISTAGLHALINTRAKKLGIQKTMHHLRRNRCILLIEAEFTDPEIASEMGWTIDDVKQMKQIYAGSEVIVAARVKQLKKARNVNRTNKPTSE
ncbi:MAG: tyrosine-type recombinase/integrase [Pseudomonadota bacterium]